MKSILSNKFLILKYGIEKYLVKNLGIFVPSSSGDYKVLGRETLKAAHKVFPLLKKLQEINHPKVQIKNSLFNTKKIIFNINYDNPEYQI